FGISAWVVLKTKNTSKSFLKIKNKTKHKSK
ncbi:Hypothetical protein HP17_03594, partial [Helicobacter pylori NCTC 11637 = CCUG 17874 = ATCC 43504 = JCM 12093]